MNDQTTIAFYDGSAGEYADRFGRTTPDKSLREFIDEVPSGGLVLDLGCGPGHAAAMMQAEGLTVEATDLSEGMVEAARKAGVDARVAGFDDLTATNRYDGIYANFSLLHAARADMPRYLAAIHTALKSGGIFHLGLKNGTGEKRDHLGRFYTFYTDAELTGLLENTGFTVIFRREGEEAGMAGTVDPFIIIRARA